MLQVIVYALAISAALGLMAFCAERLATMLGRSRRFIWAATMVLSILWPLGMMLRAGPAEIATPVAVKAELPRPARIAVEPAAPIAGEEIQEEVSVPMLAPVDTQMQAPTSRWIADLASDRTLLLAWAALSGALLLHFAGTNLLLHYRASRWRYVRVMDRQVLVSDETGPALLGAWRPRLVVPRWFLDEPAATQSLILEHEQQHIAARDPLLLRGALLIAMLVPWNLPLWWQLRRLRQAIELDCDARVLRGGAEAGPYGEVLLAVTQRAGTVPAGAVAMSEPLSALERRIRYLTAGPARYSLPRAFAALVFWAIGMGVGFALEAPPLPRSPAKVDVAHPVAAAAPVLPVQIREVSSPPSTHTVATPKSAPVLRKDGADISAQWNRIKDSCVKCHNSTDWAAGVAFDTMSFDTLGSDAKVWEAAVRRLRTRTMPPATEKRPDEQAVRSVVGLLEDRLDAAHVQSQREQGGDAKALKLSATELASRMALFLWGSPPDDELLQAAARGKLDDARQLAAQVRRMLADPKAMSLVANFGSQWLNLARMDEIKPASPDLRPLLKRELELFLDSVLRSNQPVTALMTADHTYVNEALAPLYGLTSVQGEEFRRVTLPDSRRHGLLGKGAVLMATSMPNRSSPTLRGSWILDRLLGMPGYSPPPNVGGLAEDANGNPARLRELLVLHLQNRTCFSCHGLMDPLGFALENFDAVGQLRERDPDTGAAVDTTGTLPDGTRLTGPDDLRRKLMASPEQFVQTVTEQLMAYALGRATDWQDMPAVRQIVRNAAKDNYRFASIVSQVVASDAFRHRESPERNPK